MDIQTTKQDLLKIIDSSTNLEQTRIEIFGRNGILNDLFSKIKDIPANQKKQYGADLNNLKLELENAFNSRNISVETHDRASLQKWVYPP